MKLSDLINESFDKESVREVVLYIENDGKLYASMTKPIIANLKKHMAKGKYDKTNALKSWLRLARAGAAAYDKEYMAAGEKLCTPADIKQVAVELEENNRDELSESLIRESFNEDAVDELVSYIDNDEGLYSSMTMPIINSLKGKGNYDKAVAVKAWMRLAKAGASGYTKTHGKYEGKPFTPADIKQVAVELESNNRDEVND